MGAQQRVPIRGVSRPKRPKRLMSCPEVTGNPHRPFRQVMNAERNNRASSRAVSPRLPRQRLPRSHVARQHRRTSRQTRRTEVRFRSATRQPRKRTNPKAHSARGEGHTSYSRSAAGDASGRHLQSTFQRRAPDDPFGYGKNLPWIAQFTPRRTASSSSDTHPGCVFRSLGGAPTRTLTPLSPLGARLDAYASRRAKIAFPAAP